MTRTILGGERRRRRENQFSPSEISGTKCWGEEGEGNSTFGRFGCSKKSKFNNVSICCFFKRILHTSLGHLQKCELRDVIDIIFLLGNSFIPMCWAYFVYTHPKTDRPSGPLAVSNCTVPIPLTQLSSLLSFCPQGLGVRFFLFLFFRVYIWEDKRILSSLQVRQPKERRGRECC